jgi:predicted chitinase
MTTQTPLKRFVYPFPMKVTPAEGGTAPATNNAAEAAKKGVHPVTYVGAWAATTDGFFPLGLNGQYHGGIHFDNGSGALLEQDKGILSIADGEVIAYRVNSDYPRAKFAKGDAIYSTGFVLIRHRLQLPASLFKTLPEGQPPAPAPAPAPTPTPVSAGLEGPPAPPPAPPAPPAAPEPPSITLYSLYMHLSRWKDYEAEDSTLKRPGFWDSIATDTWEVNIVEDNKPPWVTDSTLPAKGLNVHAGSDATGWGNKPGWLPKGTRLTLKPGQGPKREIDKIISGTPQYDPAHPLPSGSNSGCGWVYFPALIPVKATKPAKLDAVHVLPTPRPIEAGELVGHLGTYMRYNPEVLGNNPQRSMVHLELLAGRDLPKFVDTCRRAAKNCDASAKTILVMNPNTEPVTFIPATGTLPQGEFVALDKKETKSKADYVRVLRYTVEIKEKGGELQGWNETSNSYKGGYLLISMVKPAADGTLEEKTYAEHKALPAAEQDLYTKRKVFKPNGTAWVFTKLDDFKDVRKGGFVEVHQEGPMWDKFPLQVGQNKLPLHTLNTWSLATKWITGVITDDKGLRWWPVSLRGEKGPLTGYVCEKDHPNVELCSPWAWPAFAITPDDDTPPAEWFNRKILDEYKEEYPLFNALTTVVKYTSLPGYVMATVAEKTLKQPDRYAALRTAPVAWALSRKIFEHESEWGLPMSEWDKLDSKMAGGGANMAGFWKVEKKRIESLRWWDEVKGQHDFPTDIVAHQLHPLGVIENFSEAQGCGCKELTPELLKVIAPNASMEKIELYLPYITQMFEKYDIKDCLFKAHILAQFMTESAQLRATKEDGTPQYLQSMGYYPWIGRGLIQLTGQGLYKAYGKYVSGDEQHFMNGNWGPLETVPHCVFSAGWFLIVEKKTQTHGDEDDFLWMTATVNGGYNGHDDRLIFINRIIKTLNMHSHLKKNHNGTYLFEESLVYNSSKLSFGWGAWNDRAYTLSHGKAKNDQEAIKGYRRFLQLQSAAGNPNNTEKWYRLGSHPLSWFRDYATTHLQALGGSL